MAPGHSMAPAVGSPRPAMILRAVDLPQPEGPSRLMNSPPATSSDMSLSASVPLENVLEIARSETSGLPPAACGTVGTESSGDAVGHLGFCHRRVVELQLSK